MCDLEADVPSICAAYGFDPIPFLDSAVRLGVLAEDGIVDIDKGFIRVRPEHRFVMRAVAAVFRRLSRPLTLLAQPSSVSGSKSITVRCQP